MRPVGPPMPQEGRRPGPVRQMIDPAVEGSRDVLAVLVVEGPGRESIWASCEEQEQEVPPLVR